VDVIVLGGGPGGRALATACGLLGLDTALVDPRPDRPWTATYAAWSDELPASAPVAATAPTTRAIALGTHDLDRWYAVLDNERLRELPPAVRVLQGKVVETAHGPLGSTVHLADGRRLACALVVDATGAPPGAGRVEQTAVGVVVPAAEASALVGPGEALIMDWRQPPSAGEWPTFLYAVPLAGGRVLLEETSLARRPGLPFAELRRRLHARLTVHGITPSAEEELVRFPVDPPMPTHLAFGAAAAVVHPATGYSVATSLTLAPQVAAAIADALPGGPRSARMAARHVVWSPAAKIVHGMRRHGLHALLALPPEQVPEFFELFFRLPPELRRAYLSGRDDVAGTAHAMAALFRTAPWRLRHRFVLPTKKS
jgi:lycopene beta-cyclase